MIKINERDLKNINDKFKKIDEFARFRAIDKLADEVYEKADEYADKHTKTGELIRSLYMTKIDSGYIIGFDTVKAPHALFVHYGTKPHIIKPKEKKALRWAVGESFAFAKWVNHPGYKGDPFLQNALNDGLKEFDRWIDSELR